ncbi:MAG: SBBP repeat-containing protein, partial [Thermoplasmata archaeon]
RSNFSTSDIATIKYDPSGNELWMARYDGPAHLEDVALAITLDSIGNVYVTGDSWDPMDIWPFYPMSDYVTIKYDPFGNELWAARYNGPGYSSDSPNAIAVDLLGNVYVTGSSYEYLDDFATIKYDPSGNELWVARYNSPGNHNDHAKEIALDSMGNVYVTGYTDSEGSDYDYMTIAYDTDGNELWTAKYDGPVNGRDYSNAIVIDQFDNIYVTGYSDSKPLPYPNGNSDYATIKYDSNGNQLWVARYNGPGNDNDYGVALTLDSLGNIYVTGSSHGNGTYRDYATVAYDPSGTELWVARYNGPTNTYERAEDIAADSSGNIYVTGDGGETQDSDYTTIAYDSLGNQLWVANYNGPGNDRDEVFDMALDVHGNVYVTGRSSGGGSGWESLDCATIKYSHPWVRPKASIDIDPDTLNLKSKGRWITCYIDLPFGYDVNDIEIETVILEEVIPSEWGDIQNTTLMVKFDRSEVEDMLSPGTYNLKVTGEFTDGTVFEGYSDEIRVIGPP